MMITAPELLKMAKAREAELRKDGLWSDKGGHVIPCPGNFDYSEVAKGDPDVLKLAIREIKGGRE